MVSVLAIETNYLTAPANKMRLCYDTTQSTHTIKTKNNDVNLFIHRNDVTTTTHIKNNKL
jgi:hypothetical protein